MGKERQSIRGKLIYGLLLAVLAAALAAGCGGDDDEAGTMDADTAQPAREDGGGSQDGGAEGGEDDGTGDAGSKPVFLEEADAICREVNERTASEFNEALAVEANGPQAEQRLQRKALAEVMVPRLEERIERISALDTPPSAQEAADVVVSGFERLLKAARTGDVQRFEAVVDNTLQKHIRAAERQGFEGCAGYLG